MRVASNIEGLVHLANIERVLGLSGMAEFL